MNGDGSPGKATSYQNIHIQHFHAVPTYIKKEHKHLLEHPLPAGQTDLKVEIHHGHKQDPGYAYINNNDESFTFNNAHLHHSEHSEAEQPANENSEVLLQQQSPYEASKTAVQEQYSHQNLEAQNQQYPYQEQESVADIPQQVQEEIQQQYHYPNSEIQSQQLSAYQDSESAVQQSNEDPRSNKNLHTDTRQHSVVNPSSFAAQDQTGYVQYQIKEQNQDALQHQLQEQDHAQQPQFYYANVQQGYQPITDVPRPNQQQYQLVAQDSRQYLRDDYNYPERDLSQYNTNE